MGDDIKDRLQTSAQNCLAAYQKWEGNKKDGAAKAALQDAVHELRKVSSRLEIELAVSERDESSKKQIPIPPHRDAKKRVPVSDEMDDDAGNANDDAHHGGGHGGKSSGGGTQNRGRRRGPRKTAGGGGEE